LLNCPRLILNFLESIISFANEKKNLEKLFIFTVSEVNKEEIVLGKYSFYENTL